MIRKQINYGHGTPPHGNPDKENDQTDRFIQNDTDTANDPERTHTRGKEGETWT